MSGVRKHVDDWERPPLSRRRLNNERKGDSEGFHQQQQRRHHFLLILLLLGDYRRKRIKDLWSRTEKYKADLSSASVAIFGRKKRSIFFLHFFFNSTPSPFAVSYFFFHYSIHEFDFFFAVPKKTLVIFHSFEFSRTKKKEIISGTVDELAMARRWRHSIIGFSAGFRVLTVAIVWRWRDSIRVDALLLFRLQRLAFGP